MEGDSTGVDDLEEKFLEAYAQHQGFARNYAQTVANNMDWAPMWAGAKGMGQILSGTDLGTGASLNGWGYATSILQVGATLGEVGLGTGMAETGLQTARGARYGATNRLPVNAAEEVLQQVTVAEHLRQAPEGVRGFRIWGNKGLVGTSYNRSILLIEAERKGASSPRALLAQFEAEARAAGAEQVSIIGHAVINQKLLNLDPQLLERLGWSFRQINDESFQLLKLLE
jgi:hypothetical protein